MCIDKLRTPNKILSHFSDGFSIREAQKEEMDEIYLMGIDAWRGNCNFDEYINDCRGSIKYRKGIWYVLERNDELLSSVIIYKLPSLDSLLTIGIGSLATKENKRMNGYSSRLLKFLIEEYIKQLKVCVFVLFSDVDTHFYEKFGFRVLSSRLQYYSGSHCMVKCNNTIEFKSIEKFLSKNSIFYF